MSVLFVSETETRRHGDSVQKVPASELTEEEITEGYQASFSATFAKNDLWNETRAKC